MACCCRWNLSGFFKICFCFVLLYNKSLMTGPLGNSEFCFLEVLGKQNSLFPSEPVIKCKLHWMVICFNSYLLFEQVGRLLAPSEFQWSVCRNNCCTNAFVHQNIISKRCSHLLCLRYIYLAMSRTTFPPSHAVLLIHGV